MNRTTGPTADAPEVNSMPAPAILTRSAGLPVAVVGAGIAGVTAAAYLRQEGIPVKLYEASTRVAGLASSFRDADGFTNDFGAHFITNRLAAAIGVGAQCRDVRHYGEAVLLGGKTYGYPAGLLANPRFVASGISARLRRQPASAHESVAEWFRANYGRALADEVAIPLVEAWSGAKAEDLAASVASGKLQNGPLRSLWLKAASVVTRRAVANGYSHEMPENPSVWHVYPEGGVSILVEKLAEGLEGVVALESPVEKILVDSGRAVAVRVKGREEEVSAVISTAPCNILPKLVAGTDALNHLSHFRFRPMTFVNLRLRGRGLIPDTVLWTPEAQFPFFRVTETTTSMPWLAPPGKCLLTVDFGCEKGDATWTASDDQLVQLCLEHLAAVVPDIRERYLGVQVLRTPIAYPVFLNAYEPDRLRLKESTGVEGLYSIGRNGEFAHILMEDVYWRTLKRMRQLVRGLGREA
jgi:protoporphyrinogen/coproporphyrinogen III oxidase